MGRKNKSDESFSVVGRLARAEGALTKIIDTMSGVEWDAQTMNQVSEILHEAGYEIAEPDPERVPPAVCPNPTCGKREELCVTESYTAMHPYDAQRHTAKNALGYGTDELDDGHEDYKGLCRACGHTGELAEFGMKLLDWNSADEDYDDEPGED